VSVRVISETEAAVGDKPDFPPEEPEDEDGAAGYRNFRDHERH
jgi:hypothetical protein